MFKCFTVVSYIDKLFYCAIYKIIEYFYYICLVF